jgi:hypothetical protein
MPELGLPGRLAPAILMVAVVIFSFFARAAEWTPTEFDDERRPLFTQTVALELAQLQSDDVGRSDQEHQRLDELLVDPEMRLAYELVPEIVGEHVLRRISEPAEFHYVISDRSGRSFSYEVAKHPIFRPLRDVLESGKLSAAAIRGLAERSSYVDVASKALNDGEKLSDLSISVTPIGLVLNKGKLEIGQALN